MELNSKLNNNIMESTIDFFNLVFGFGQETDFFWDEILKQEIFKKFKYTLTCTQNEIKMKGSLLNSTLKKCRIKFEYNLDVPLFKKQCPFKKQDFSEFIFECNSFKLNYLREKMLSVDDFCPIGKSHIFTKINVDLNNNMKNMEIENIMENNKIEIIPYFEKYIENLIDKGSMEKALNEINTFFNFFQTNSDSMIEKKLLQIKILFKKLDFDIINNVIEDLFNLIEFNFGLNHPISGIVYSIIGNLYLNINMYSVSLSLFQSSLSNFKRLLDSNNIYLGFVYMNLADIYFRKMDYEETYKILNIALYYYENTKFEFPDSYIKVHESLIACLNNYSCENDGIYFNNILFY